MKLRAAGDDDIPQLELLIRASVRQLQLDYSESQREAALGSIFGVDRSLIADGTYFVLADDAGKLAACGGWSRRATLFGGDASPVKEERWLDPARDAARIRAFFVAPALARQGLGTRLLQACEEAARRAGFTRLELMATLAGVPLYARHGFVPVEETTATLVNGEALPLVRMRKDVVKA